MFHMTMLSEIPATDTSLSSDVPSALQVFILDSLATYKPRDGKDAESIVERVTPRLQHANCAVVLSAVKVGGQGMYVILVQTHFAVMFKLMYCLACCKTSYL